MMLPKENSVLKWAASLIVDFPLDNVPILRSEAEWKPWGNLLIQETSFAILDAPDPELFDSPVEWMQEVCKVMFY